MPAHRSRILPSRGTLLVSTDLHGNLDDYLALERIFLAALERREDVRWAILGDLIHGPAPRHAEVDPRFYAYRDESARLVQRVIALREKVGDRLILLLGNHEHGHVGGIGTAKFHDDEVAHLEGQLSQRARLAMHKLFEESPLLLAARCGILFSHGSPGDELESLAQLEGPLHPLAGPMAGAPLDRTRWRAIQSILWSYGQAAHVTRALLERLSREVGFSLRMVIHGHDRDEHGVLIEGDNQLQPVIFGALKNDKRYLWLDLAARYQSVRELREGAEIRRLYPA